MAKLRPGGRLLRLAAACCNLVAVYCVEEAARLRRQAPAWRPLFGSGEPVGDELQMTALRGAQAYSLRGY